MVYHSKMKKIKRIILYIWQMPQNLLGWGMTFLLGNDLLCRFTDDGMRYYLQNRFQGGVTLGEYIFVRTDEERRVRHETGHVHQSRLLGPFYLIVVGIPSLIHAALNNRLGCCRRSKRGYSHFYTERWADKIAGL